MNKNKDNEFEFFSSNNLNNESFFFYRFCLKDKEKEKICETLKINGGVSHKNANINNIFLKKELFI